MSTPIVLVHGSFHGGWCWRRLVPLLAAAGHRVWTPTLAGLAERSTQGHAAIGLATHIEEISQLLEYEDLHDVLLVGHSYAGMVASGVAERQPSRIRRLVYLDAFVPADGQAMFDFLPRHFAREWAAAAEASTGWGIPPPPPEVFGLTDADDIAWVRARLTPMPLATHNETIHLPRDHAAGLRRSYLWCRQSGVLEATAARIQQSPGWDFQALDAGHDIMLTAADLLAQALVATLALDNGALPPTTPQDTGR